MTRGRGHRMRTLKYPHGGFLSWSSLPQSCSLFSLPPLSSFLPTPSFSLPKYRMRHTYCIISQPQLLKWFERNFWNKFSDLYHYLTIFDEYLKIESSKRCSCIPEEVTTRQKKSLPEVGATRVLANAALVRRSSRAPPQGIFQKTFLKILGYLIPSAWNIRSFHNDW